MRSISPLTAILVLFLGGLLAGCDAFFGAKDDPTTDEIFREGAIDPSLFDDVAYVPLFPFFQQGANGGLDAPSDVYVGYDEFVYVTDRQGLHVLDLAGRPLNFIGQANGQPIRGAGCVIQDRRLDVYVCARRDTTITETTIVLGDTTVTTRTWDLAVIYRFSGLTTGSPRVADVIWHVFDDRSRRFNVSFRNPRVFDGGISDEEAEFTGVGVLANNDIYVARRGPLNRRGTPAQGGDGRPATVYPFNSLLLFTRGGENTGRIDLRADDATVPTLRSSVYPSAILTYFAPPQRTGLAPRLDFFVAQAPPPEASVPRPPFGVLAINAVQTSDGLVYQPDASRVGAAADPTRGDGFLYEEFKFQEPVGLARAEDGTGYLFVVDAGKDSLFVFNDLGIEGVNPPPGAQDRSRPAVVSFGGLGPGPLQFNDPQGVAYYRRTVYVADRGNNRISRYRLNTDFE